MLRFSPRRALRRPLPRPLSAPWLAPALACLSPTPARALPARAHPIAHVDLGRTRPTLVHIPAGTFRMGTDEVIRADDRRKPRTSCPVRDEVEHPAHPVGEKRPNDFGLCDMPGNVWQWCDDWFAIYPDSAVHDPRDPPRGERRISRGGCHDCDTAHERATCRNRDLEDHASPSVGFRVVPVARNPADTLGPGR